MFNFNIYIMEIPQIIGAGLIVIGAGLGIGKLVVQQWTHCFNQKLQERSKQLCLCSCTLKIGFAALFAS
jgi:hypothetical protein